MIKLIIISMILFLTSCSTSSSKYLKNYDNTNPIKIEESISGLNIGANGIIIEGSTADAHEVTLNAQDPTQDNVITIPNADMTAITNAQFATKGSHFAKVLALG